jgi:hypothetical protein
LSLEILISRPLGAITHAILYINQQSEPYDFTTKKSCFATRLFFLAKAREFCANNSAVTANE